MNDSQDVFPDDEPDVDIETDKTNDSAIVTPTDTPVVVVKDDPKKPYKAYASTGMSFLAIFIALWIGDDDPFTKKEAAQALLSALLGSGLVGGTAYGISNPKTSV